MLEAFSEDAARGVTMNVLLGFGVFSSCWQLFMILRAGSRLKKPEILNILNKRASLRQRPIRKFYVEVRCSAVSFMRIGEFAEKELTFASIQAETVRTVSLLAMVYDFYKITYILQRGLL